MFWLQCQSCRSPVEKTVLHMMQCIYYSVSVRVFARLQSDNVFLQSECDPQNVDKFDCTPLVSGCAVRSLVASFFLFNVNAFWSRCPSVKRRPKVRQDVRFSVDCDSRSIPFAFLLNPSQLPRLPPPDLLRNCKNRKSEPSPSVICIVADFRQTFDSVFSWAPLLNSLAQMWASACGQLDCAESLCNWSATELRSLDVLGRSPAAVARQRGHMRIYNRSDWKPGSDLQWNLLMPVCATHRFRAGKRARTQWPDLGLFA